MDGLPGEDILAEQISYYRQRAGEYDTTAYGDVSAAGARITRLVDELRPTGTVLEIACGTGMWTGALAQHASALTAIDAAPEAVEIARSRAAAPHVTFAVADVFGWLAAPPTQRFDVVFFSHWLSHVPASHLDRFWAGLRPLLTASGRVLFVDEHVGERAKESYPAGGELARRTLVDGRPFRIVKNYLDAGPLVARLDQLGWACAIHRDGEDWICGTARPIHRPAPA